MACCGLGHEVQHQQRQHAVEAAVGTRQRAGIADFERGAGVAVVPRGMGHIDRRDVDAEQLLHAAALQQRERQTAGAAAHVEHPLAIGHADEIEKRLGEAPAPAPHLQFVAVAIGGEKVGCRCGGHGPPVWQIARRWGGIAGPRYFVDPRHADRAAARALRCG